MALVNQRRHLTAPTAPTTSVTQRRPAPDTRPLALPVVPVCVSGLPAPPHADSADQAPLASVAVRAAYALVKHTVARCVRAPSPCSCPPPARPDLIAASASAPAPVLTSPAPLHPPTAAAPAPASRLPKPPARPAPRACALSSSTPTHLTSPRLAPKNTPRSHTHPLAACGSHRPGSRCCCLPSRRLSVSALPADKVPPSAFLAFAPCSRQHA